MPKISLVFSDIEIGGGTKTDDFVEEKLLTDTIKKHFKEAKKNPSDLVLNGDIFDFLKCPYRGKYPKHITEKVSLIKFKKILKAHPLFFKTLKLWLNNSSKSRIIFITGNHDYDTVFPKIQEMIKKAINQKEKERIIFPGFEYTDNLVHFEHGSQLDPIFKVDPSKFIHYSKKHNGQNILRIPWGYGAIYDYFIYLKESFSLLERVSPKRLVLERVLPKYKFKILKYSFLFLLKSFFYTQFKNWDDTLYRFSPYQFFHFTQLLVRKQFEMLIINKAKKKIIKGPWKIISIGHNHKGSIHKLKGKIILNTGSWRDEYHLKDETCFPQNKSYGYIQHTKNKIYKIDLIEVKSKQKPFSLKQLEKTITKEKQYIDKFFL